MKSISFQPVPYYSSQNNSNSGLSYLRNMLKICLVFPIELSNSETSPAWSSLVMICIGGLWRLSIQTRQAIKFWEKEIKKIEKIAAALPQHHQHIWVDTKLKQYKRYHLRTGWVNWMSARRQSDGLVLRKTTDPLISRASEHQHSSQLHCKSLHCANKPCCMQRRRYEHDL